MATLTTTFWRQGRTPWLCQTPPPSGRYTTILVKNVRFACYKNTSAYKKKIITHLVNYSSTGSVTTGAGVVGVAGRTLVELYESWAADRGGDGMVYHWPTAESKVG